MERFKQFIPPNWSELAAIWGTKLAVSILIFIGFWVGSLFVRWMFRRLSERSDPQRGSVIKLIGTVIRMVLLIFGFVTAMGTLGINVSALVAGLGLTGFALGFAFRDALSNVLAGIMILFYRPFRHGDHVTITGLEGTVTGIDLRYTTISTEKKTFLIPNSILLTNAITVTRVS